VFSSLQLIGFGYRRVTKIDTDDEGRMQSQALVRAPSDKPGPKIVVAQAGQINTGAFDPFTEIVALARGAGAWVHVDGAFGLWARAVPGLRHLTEGIEGADSWVTDGHKWLQVPYDCGFAVVRDRTIHQRAMTQWSSYLPTIGEGDRVPSAFVPELSRRARGVPVYALLKASSLSWPHSPQRSRRKPWARMPHSRKASNSGALRFPHLAGVNDEPKWRAGRADVQPRLATSAQATRTSRPSLGNENSTGISVNP
jgi:hypothetical protein